MDTIRLRGVRVHNLRGLDLDLPKGKLTVITGVSGSGKSSLAFDTLYAEGQRRYVESLSTYARQFLERMDRPDVDSMDGIPPAVAIRQASMSAGGRSTVGTVTEVNDYLRLLWTRVGRTWCLKCGRLVEVDTVEKIADRFLRSDSGGSPRRLLICYPLDAAAVLEKVSPAEVIADLRASGFRRLLVDGEARTLEEAEARPFTRRSRVAVAVDRLVAREESRSRLAESLETAYRFGHGRCLVVGTGQGGEGPGEEHPFSLELHCASCDIGYRLPSPAFFSFNSPLGACAGCQGFGRSIELDMDLIIPDRTKTLAQRPIEPWNFPAYGGAWKDLERAARRRKIPLDIPYERLKSAHRRWIEEGGSDFYGVKGFFEWLESRTYKVHVRVFLSRFRAYRTCPSCNGARLREEALAVKVGGLDIAQVSAMPTAAAAAFFSKLHLTDAEREIAAPVLLELRRRLRYLVDVGLAYITLDRLSRTLSGGEAQRIHLASALGSGLVGTLYVLDEPSIGLHARDNDRLIRILHSLRDLGNTVVVVEHDPAIIRAADHVVDLGPGAGERGGRVVAAGTPHEIAASEESLTGQYLSGWRVVPAARRRRRPSRSHWVVLEGARANNLKDITARFPLGLLCCVTGVSGSGKSSLVTDTLYPALRRAKGEVAREIGPFDCLTGADRIDGAVLVDQSPVGRTPRSNPVTYIGAFSEIREAFAGTEAARAAGLKAGDFSFNRPGGRCEACQGGGMVTAEMHFLADVTLTCEACGGSRYKDRTLEVQLRGRTIADVLHMTVREACSFFRDRPALVRKLSHLAEAGLGYLRLGQSATTLSGGEAQRLKLAEAISRGKGHTLYVFDEPTTGLHLDDVATLLGCLNRLIERGNSVLVVEHHLEVVRNADWIIDLGPEAAGGGGRVVAAGPPEEIASCPRSITGRYLAPLLAKGEEPLDGIARGSERL